MFSRTESMITKIAAIPHTNDRWSHFAIAGAIELIQASQREMKNSTEAMMVMMGIQ